jgi:hypothetical protein
MAHGYGSALFRAYPVTSQGVQTSPVLSAIGSVHGNDNTSNTIGQIKFSPDGRKLAVAVFEDWFFEVFDFNTQTGLLSNPVTLQNPNLYKSGAYSVEFSPDGSKLYVLYSRDLTIDQYNLRAGSPQAIKNLLVTILNWSINNQSVSLRPEVRNLQLATDGKICVMRSANPGYPTLDQAIGIIEQPNEPGLACAYKDRALDGFGEIPIMNPFCFPSFPAHLLNPVPRIVYETGCLGSATQFWIAQQGQKLFLLIMPNGNGSLLTRIIIQHWRSLRIVLQRLAVIR